MNNIASGNLSSPLFKTAQMLLSGFPPELPGKIEQAEGKARERIGKAERKNVNN
jgi:hypothetical protein